MNAITEIKERVTEINVSVAHDQRRWLRPGALAAAALLLLTAWWFLFRPTPVAIAPVPRVAVAMPLAREIVEWDNYVGRFAPSQSVEVRPRVAGAIVGLHFRDGEVVRKGQLLFTIDPRPFVAAAAEAHANVASAQSSLALARSDLARATRLTGDESLSAGEIDGLRARLRAAEAALAGAEAHAQARDLDVDFTTIRAPITGRISDRRVDVGNLVAGGEGSAATLLTTIYALDPIYFQFDASEALYLKAQRNKSADVASSPVEIRLQDEPAYRWKGTIDFTDNGLDSRSGTIRGRAVLDNHDYFLTPGMFGNMRLANAAKTTVLLVPDAAIQTDQARKTLLVVGQDGVVATKPVELGPAIGELRVIHAGLSPEDRVVVSGTQFAQPGSKVDPQVETIASDPAASPAPVSAPPAAEATYAAQ